VKLGRGPVCGTTRRGGAGGGTAGAEVTTGLGVGAAGGVTGAAGFTAAGADMDAAGTTGGAGVGGAAGCCLLMMAFKTSPGLEICERSILVLISPGSERGWRCAAVGAG
jgi:hypothetical protein